MLIDVDGVISIWGFDPDRRPPGVLCSVDGIPHYLSDGAATRILRLSQTFDCAWCTGWEDRADEHLPHLLGIPSGWPHLLLDSQGGSSRHHAEPSRHWKLGAIDAFAGPHRPVAWIDDALTEACTEWAQERPGPTLLVHTEPATGLLDEHVDVLERWAAEL